MNVSVLNRVQIPQQFLESWLRPIGVKGKFGGGYGAEHGDGARTGKVPQCHACSGLTRELRVSPDLHPAPCSASGGQSQKDQSLLASSHSNRQG